ncbi:phage minor capsid protein [Streptomyces sp. DSM 44917]|uniref:Phage minor capsid protein n=1 Tax=Streptomyces boetiae TaxID=3075541 RepID=A0ABU2L3I2_9ACTN|nr:phage minor capsid protein [Streptomyces sp. DSM 44917]MDT0306119.1 phage minor capsid protein [Streptomyces sp. DSM 44917]
MPVSPAMAENLAGAVAGLYEAAEVTIIERIAGALARGLESPLWAELRLAAVGSLRDAVGEVVAALQQDADGAIRAAVAAAYARGQQAAVAELGALSPGRAAAARRLPGAPAVDRLAAGLLDEVRPVYSRVTRVSDDVYRQVVARASAAPLLGVQTRRQAAQTALDRFADRGVTGFVDARGRGWDMRSYVEMATRTTVGRAAVEAHTGRLAAAGIDLVMVSDSPEECPRCRPWERKVLVREGPSGARTVEVEHSTEDGRTVSVRVAGSLAEARAAGLQHPNCRHTVSAYLPGVTRTPPRQEDRGTYEQTQQQRYLERQVRQWKRRAAAALDDDKRRQANAKVRAYQRRIRELTAETGLPRKSQREQAETAR